MSDAREPFCGRSEQLDALRGVWQEVRGGDGPRAAVILGESGLGKTRLVQEFYAWLVATEQRSGAAYWPATLAQDGNNLYINAVEASWDAAAPLPFLWWGIRLANPQDHNQVVAGALASHVGPYLVPHLEPLNRELRRRQRVRDVAKVGGAVAVDLALDLVPVLGLLKRFGEVGLELKGVHDAWRRDRQVLSAQEQAQERRTSLVTEVISDLGKLFSAPAELRVPAVIIIDDAQYSPSDPAMAEFVLELLTAAAAGEWPLLLVVTHWQREWAQQQVAAAGSTIASALVEVASRLQVEAGPALRMGVLTLGPIADLSPALAGRLPGLSAQQAAALLERVGGNPRFLDEVLRLVDLGGRGMFVGRDPAGPLTEAALAELLAASTGLVELMRRRLMQSPEEVQKAVVLAGLQGDAFLRQLVETTAVALAEAPGSVDAAVTAAANPHAYLAATFPGVGAFVQPVYREVANARLGFWYDPTEAKHALTAAVRERMNAELGRSTPEQVVALYDLAARLLADQDDPGDRRTAAHALHWLSAWAQRRGDTRAAAALAVRLGKLLATIPDELLSRDLDWLNITAAKVGLVGENALQGELLARALRLAEAGAGAVGAGAAAEGRAQLAVALAALASFEESRGRRDAARELWERAVAEVAGLPGEGLAVLEYGAAVLAGYASWLENEGRLDAAAEAYRACLPRLERVKELDPGSADHHTRSELTCLVGLAGCALLAGNAEEAESRFRAALKVARELVEKDPSPESRSKLSETLHRLASTLMHRTGPPNAEAAGYVREALALARSNLAAAPGIAWAQRAVASLLESSPVHVIDEPDGLDLAWQYVQEALALWREVASREPPGSTDPQLAKCLLRVADVAYARGEYAVAKVHMTESLGIARAAVGKVSDAVATLGLMAAIPQAALIDLALGDVESARALLDEADGLYPSGAAASPGLADAVAARVAAVRQQLPS